MSLTSNWLKVYLESRHRTRQSASFAGRLSVIASLRLFVLVVLWMT